MLVNECNNLGFFSQERGLKMLNSKMKGIVDPYTLGILISIVGAIVVNMAHEDQQPDQQMLIPMDTGVFIPEGQSRYRPGDELSG